MIVNYRTDYFSLKEGRAVLQWPHSMDIESLEFFEEWLRIEIKSIRRRVESKLTNPELLEGE